MGVLLLVQWHDSQASGPRWQLPRERPVQTPTAYPASLPQTFQVGLRLVDALRRHMARQRFCPLGALCWRRDLQEYRRAARADGPAARQLAEMEAEAGLLVVAPEALPGLVGSTLGLTAQRARQVIALRADWGEAGARGKRLAALFPDDQRR